MRSGHSDYVCDIVESVGESSERRDRDYTNQSAITIFELHIWPSR